MDTPFSLLQKPQQNLKMVPANRKRHNDDTPLRPVWNDTTKHYGGFRTLYFSRDFTNNNKYKSFTDYSNYELPKVQQRKESSRYLPPAFRRLAEKSHLPPSRVSLLNPYFSNLTGRFVPTPRLETHLKPSLRLHATNGEAQMQPSVQTIKDSETGDLVSQPPFWVDLADLASSRLVQPHNDAQVDVIPNKLLRLDLSSTNHSLQSLNDVKESKDDFQLFTEEELLQLDLLTLDDEFTYSFNGNDQNDSKSSTLGCEFLISGSQSSSSSPTQPSDDCNSKLLSFGYKDTLQYQHKQECIELLKESQKTPLTYDRQSKYPALPCCVTSKRSLKLNRTTPIQCPNNLSRARKHQTFIDQYFSKLDGVHQRTVQHVETGRSITSTSTTVTKDKPQSHSESSTPSFVLPPPSSSPLPLNNDRPYTTVSPYTKPSCMETNKVCSIRYGMQLPKFWQASSQLATTSNESLQKDRCLPLTDAAIRQQNEPKQTVLSLRSSLKIVKEKDQHDVKEEEVSWELIPLLSKDESSRLVTPSMLLEVATAIREEWRHLGQIMGLPEKILNEVYSNYKNRGSEEMAYQMMKVWREKQSILATVGLLRSHLLHFGVKECTEVQLSLRFLYANAAPLCNKLRELSMCARIGAFDFIAITESHCFPRLTDEKVAISGYHIYRTDRISGRGGGVAIYVRNSAYVSEHHSIRDSDGAFEIVWCHVHLRGGPQFVVCCCYRTCKQKKESRPKLKELLTALSEVVHRSRIFPIYILGDFNFGKIDWESQTAPQGCASDLLSWAEANGLTQHVKDSTRYRVGQKPSLLDLVFSNCTDDVTHLSCDAPVGNSDHCTISGFINLTHVGNEILARKMLDDQNDYVTMRYVLYGACWRLIRLGTIDEAWEKFRDLLLKLADDLEEKKDNKVWSETTYLLLNNKHRLWAHYAKSTHLSDWKEYSTSRYKLDSAMMRDLLSYKQNVVRTLSTVNVYPYRSFYGRELELTSAVVLKCLERRFDKLNNCSHFFSFLFRECRLELSRCLAVLFRMCVDDGLPVDWIMTTDPCFNTADGNKGNHLSSLCFETFKDFLLATDYFTYCDIMGFAK